MQLFAGHVVGCWPVKQNENKNFPPRPPGPSNVLRSFSNFIEVGKGQVIFC